MIRLRPHRVGKAESLFVANLKPFFDSIDPSQTLRNVRFCAGVGGKRTLSGPDL
jgi:hypothetical protein